MEIRVLRYFLAVAREENITAAPRTLHVTQPTLSKQLKELEESLDTQLFIRGNRKIKLTEDGHWLRKRAQEIIDLVDRTESEMTQPEEKVSGNVYIGGGESDSIRLVTKVISKLREQFPNIQFHLYSASAEDVMEKVDNGLIDFGVVIGSVDKQNYDFRHLPTTDSWGLLVPKGSPLTHYDRITPELVSKAPLICSRQALRDNELSGWFGNAFENLNIVATYNLLFNASLMVEEGIGYALCLDKLANTTETSPLTFIPLEPKIESHLSLIWKRHVTFSVAAQKFLDVMQEEISYFSN